MSSSTTITLTAENPGVTHVDDVPASSVDVTNHFLQHNHDKWHILWDSQRAGGLHNHQVHYLLTDLALGASPEQIKEAFERNKDYQRPIEAGDECRQHTITQDNFTDSLGHHQYYAAWLQFFQDEITQKGWQDVLGEYLFAETPRADDLLGRMFEGAIHPIIHLGFGVEFSQPAIVAEALAQAAIHRHEACSFLLRTELLAKGKPSWTDGQRLMDLFHTARSTPAIKDAECFAPGSFERDGNFFAIAPQALFDLASQYNLDRSSSEETLKLRLAEMINVIAWMASACQNPKKAVKFDFFLMHAVNCSIFLSVFGELPWLNIRSKIRLLESKVRMDIVMYVTQGCPKLLTEEITNYAPRRGSEGMNWPDVIDRAKKIPCDGHVLKMIRALRHGRTVCAPYESSETTASKFPVKGDEMWLKIANMVLDSTEDHPSVLDKWMRGPGFEKAWEVIPDRK